MRESDERKSKIIPLLKECPSSNVCSYEDDEVILSEGEKGSFAYLILSGEVSIKSGNIDTHLVTRREGELIGEQALFNAEGKRSACVKALGNVKLLEFDPRDICKLDSNAQIIFWKWYSEVISHKLSQATHGRVSLDELRKQETNLLKKFVPKSGIEAARTAIFNGAEPTSFHKNAKVIIWFSDIAGFSSATKDKDPSEIAYMVSTLLGKQITLIEDTEGEIDKLMGDGLMAFWLLTSDCDVSLSVEASASVALEVNKEIKSLAQQNNWPVDIRIGLHIGDVAIGSFGTANRFAYTILGEAVNTASRYEQAKEDVLGNIRISPEIFDEFPQESHTKNLFSPCLKTFKVKGHQFNVHTLKESIS